MSSHTVSFIQNVAPESDCFQNLGIGCANSICEASVCLIRPSCCTIEWDEDCTALACETCSGIAPYGCRCGIHSTELVDRQVVTAKTILLSPEFTPSSCNYVEQKDTIYWYALQGDGNFTNITASPSGDSFDISLSISVYKDECNMTCVKAVESDMDAKAKLIFKTSKSEKYLVAVQSNKALEVDVLAEFFMVS